MLIFKWNIFKWTVCGCLCTRTYIQNYKSTFSVCGLFACLFVLYNGDKSNSIGYGKFFVMNSVLHINGWRWASVYQFAFSDCSASICIEPNYYFLLKEKLLHFKMKYLIFTLLLVSVVSKDKSIYLWNVLQIILVFNYLTWIIKWICKIQIAKTRIRSVL